MIRTAGILAIALFCSTTTIARASPSCFLPDNQLHRNVDFHITVGITTRAEVLAALGPADALDSGKNGDMRWMYHRYQITRSPPASSEDRSQWTVTVWDCYDKPGVAHANVDPKMTGNLFWIWFDRHLKVKEVGAAHPI